MTEDYYKRSLEIHKKLHGKIGVINKLDVKDRDDLSIVYTPGVAEPCRVIADDPSRARDLTIKGNSVAVVTDGSAVLGLGNIGPLAALPVMEGKALLFKKYADIDAWPICLDTQDVEYCRNSTFDSSGVWCYKSRRHSSSPLFCGGAEVASSCYSSFS